GRSDPGPWCPAAICRRADHDGNGARPRNSEGSTRHRRRCCPRSERGAVLRRCGAEEKERRKERATARRAAKTKQPPMLPSVARCRCIFHGRCTTMATIISHTEFRAWRALRGDPHIAELL